MKLIKFPEVNITYGENQPEYIPLPAFHERLDPQGRIVCCWRLTWGERLRLLWTGRIWHSILTFQRRLQPQLLTVEKPEMRK